MRALLSLMLAASSAHAYTIVVQDSSSLRHADVEIAVIHGKLTARVDSDAHGITPADDTLLYDGPVGTTSFARPASSDWDFLGVGAGQPIYIWSQSNNADRIFLGINSEPVPAGTFAAYSESDPRVTSTPTRWIKMSLVDVVFTPPDGQPSADAHFSMWNASGPAITQWMASSDGISASDAYYVLERGHSHVNWGFTHRGYYQITFRFSGFTGSSGNLIPFISEPITYHFGVEFQPLVLVPEPSSALLALLGSMLAFHRPARKPKKH
jgi:surface-anchored protein